MKIEYVNIPQHVDFHVKKVFFLNQKIEMVESYSSLRSFPPSFSSPFFLIENISNNLQFNGLELVSDHTRTGGRADNARTDSVS